VEMRSKMVKLATATWRLWLGLGLGALGTLSSVLSIGSNLMLIILALSVLMVLLGLVQFSLWSKHRRSWL
jgi:hypothetical protein